MKTRIIYPSLWEQDRVIDLSKDAKVLLFNLLTSPHLGLTPYLKVSDKYLILETSLSKNELEKARLELTTCNIFWYEGWFYLGCDFAYVDYEGRDRVLTAKKKELEAIPANILRGLEGVIKGLGTGFKPTLNYNLETINHKKGVVGGKGSIGILTDEVCSEVADSYQVGLNDVKRLKEDLRLYCESTGKKYKDYHATLQAWVRRSLANGKIKKQISTNFVPPDILEPPDEERAKRAEEIRNNLSSKLSL